MRVNKNFDASALVFILPKQTNDAYNRQMQRILRFLPLLAICILPFTVGAQTLQQGFENYPALFMGSNPWAIQNNSDSVAGGQPWFAGAPEVLPAQAGTGYVAANYRSTGGIAGTEHISNWLFSPTLNLTNGATLSFYSFSAGAAPDRLELRLSINSTSTNVGTTSSSLGDFTILLLAINPLQLAAGAVDAYPTTWTQFTATIVGVPVGATGRVGFHYDVTNSGTAGVNGDYIGVDSLTSTLTVVPEPSTLCLCAGGLLMGGWMAVRRRQAIVKTA